MFASDRQTYVIPRKSEHVASHRQWATMTFSTATNDSQTFERYRVYDIFRHRGRRRVEVVCTCVSCVISRSTMSVRNPRERTNVCQKRNLVREGASKIVSYHITDFPRCVPIDVLLIKQTKKESFSQTCFPERVSQRGTQRLKKEDGQTITSRHDTFLPTVYRVRLSVQ